MTPDEIRATIRDAMIAMNRHSHALISLSQDYTAMNWIGDLPFTCLDVALRDLRNSIDMLERVRYVIRDKE